MANDSKQVAEQGVRPVSRAALVAAALAAASGVAVGTATAQTRERRPEPAEVTTDEPEGSAAEGSAPTVEERPVTVFYGVIYNDEIRGGGMRK
jgi:hypothetical protein